MQTAGMKINREGGKLEEKKCCDCAGLAAFLHDAPLVDKPVCLNETSKKEKKNHIL